MSFVSFRAYPGASGVAPFAQSHVKSHKCFTNGPGFQSSVTRISCSKMAQVQRFNQAQVKRLNFTHFQTFSKDRPLSVYQSLVQGASVHRSSCTANSITTAGVSNDRSFELILLGLLTVLSMMDEVHADDYSDGEWERINILLKKTYDERKINEKIELFNYLLKEGEKAAKEARGKDIVIFMGNTDSGKSTLINFLFGCQMIMKDQMIVVDPKSSKKEVAPIGTGVDSCTIIPQRIPDVTVSVSNESSVMENMISGQIEQVNTTTTLTFFDMPGHSDSRGLDVALANTIVMKQVIESANSVRFVMVLEHGQLKLGKGEKWKETVKLLRDRFSDHIGTGKNSLCLVITKQNQDVENIKNTIRKYTLNDRNVLDLSEYVKVYDPLNPNGREELLNSISSIKAYRKISDKISMNGSQLWEASELGKKIQKKVEKILKQGDNARINEAVKKIQFTHGISKLGNKGLAQPHEFASQAVQEYVKREFNGMSPKNNQPLENQIESHKKYMFLKEQFGPYVSFEQMDRDVRSLIKETKDPRWVEWHRPRTAVAGLVGTLALGAGGFFFPPLWGGAAASGVASLYALKHSWSPSQEEKDMESFFDQKKYD